jgi:hypothetical protein
LIIPKPYDPEDGGAVKVMNEATEFGLADGLAVPIYTTHGFQAIVTFGRIRWCSAWSLLAAGALLCAMKRLPGHRGRKRRW